MHVSTSVSSILTDYFAAKNRQSLASTMSFFSPDLLTYTDSTLGWTLDGFDDLRRTFADYMPRWAGGASLPIRILGDGQSAVVEFIDTRELFGGELHLLGAVDFKDGKITRWVDFWDSASFDRALFAKMTAPEDDFPAELANVEERADSIFATLVRELHAAMKARDLDAVEKSLARNVVFEDMAQRIRIVGRDAVMRYLGLVLHHAPYSNGSAFSRALGGRSNGGFEWGGSPDSAVRYGLTAVELDDQSAVTRLSIAYDSARLAPSVRAYLQTTK